jgi:hypothetical protein
VANGAVATRSDWRSLRLRQDVVELDLSEHYLREVGRIVGLLLSLLDTMGGAGGGGRRRSWGCGDAACGSGVAGSLQAGYGESGGEESGFLPSGTSNCAGVFLPARKALAATALRFAA